LKLGPVEYLGVDIESGPGVDQICDGCEIVERFGEARWGLIVCTETLEHALDWRGVVSNLKRALAVDGHLLLTTRSAGFPYHGHPFDYWRFEKSDMMHIFGDMTVLRIESDPEAPGVFVYMRKQSSFRERALAAYNVASVAAKARSR
jgi:SAM-dependent methyltransferase